MSKKDNRERILQVRLSQEEFDAIERKFKNIGMKSKSALAQFFIDKGKSAERRLVVCNSKM